MPEYIVYVPEVWHQAVSVTAASEDEARQLAMDANGEIIEGLFSYSFTLEEHTQFIVEEV